MSETTKKIVDRVGDPMTGAELRAWRERLGLTREDASRAIGNALTRRESINAETVERLEGNRTFYGDPAPYVAAYRAALDAEEARQAAEREPVCPKGVTVRHESGYTFVNRAGRVWADGSVSVAGSMCADRVALRYLLDLADYRARKHAEGDRQRKLDAVKAAKEALDAASHAEEAAHTAYNDAAKARYAAQSLLCNARQEAGL